MWERDMSKKISSAILAALMLGQVAQPAWAQRRGGGAARGARAGGMQRSAAPRGTTNTYSGARGGSATTYSGARGQAATVTGPGGRTATGARGNYGGTAARGPYGTAARGPYGGTAYASRGSYYYGGRAYYRPTWNAAHINTFSRGFYGYPGWHSYGYYGLAPGLAAFGGLAFLSAGLLIGSYAQEQKTVYVYVVQEGGQNVEYRVNSDGQVLSKKVV